MDKDSKASGGSLSTTGFLWIAVLAAGAFFARDAPWQGSRPIAGEPKAYQYVAAQDTDARLWQDPVGAVRRGIEERKKRGDPGVAGRAAGDDGEQPHDVAALGRAISTAACTPNAAPVLVMGVMVSGGAYADAVEFRRRARYAALAGLSRMDFVPDDPEHLGYVLPKPAKKGDLPEFIAYEWLKPVGTQTASVLMLWLDEDLFGKAPVDRLTQLQRALALAPCPGAGIDRNVRFLVIGPEFTSTLEGMLVDAKQNRDWSPFLFYAYGATGDDAKLMAKVPDGGTDGAHDYLAKHRIDVIRTIGSDGVLADSLLNELKLRGVDLPANCARFPKPLQHIALISEWDTAYGRIWPDTILQKVLASPECEGRRDESTVHDAVQGAIHRYSYLRGLDGETATGGQAVDAASPKAARSDGDGGAPGADRSKVKLIEHPEGQSQYDYLRRLSLKIAAVDEDLRHREGEGIRAIGVLGTDTYDKLLVLQALHKQFPQVMFFTTDLDARMLHPQEQEWARNLVVASNFGLELNSALQKNIPPFRDAYQTSLYLSVLIALDNAGKPCIPGSMTDSRCITQTQVDHWLSAPRLFEIGRDIAFDYTDDVPGDCAVHDLVHCAGVHPLASQPYPTPSTAALRNGFLLIVGGLVLLGLTRGMGHRILVAIAERRTRELALLAASMALVGLVAVEVGPLWNAFAGHLTEHGHGEPMRLFEGISIWPTQAIRCVSIAFSVGFVVWGWRLLDRNLESVSRRLAFQPEHATLLDMIRAEYSGPAWPWWRLALRAFSFRLEEAHGPTSATVGLTKDAQYFWKKYIFQGHILSRLCRVVAAVVVFWLVSATVIQFFGFPVSPYRGPVSLHWNLALMVLSVTAMLFVIFFVVDATVFCSQLIGSLQKEILPLATQSKPAAPDADVDPAAPPRAPVGDDQPAVHLLSATGAAMALPTGSRWTQSTLDHYQQKFGLSAEHLDSWILMDFISLRTGVVAKLVYFPFIVISLMVLSRSSFFDNWTMPTGLVLVFVASVSIVAVCAVLLRMTAERARLGAIERLSDQLIKLKGGDETQRRAVPQIELMVAQIRALHDGAFAPYSQQPLFRALLLPLSTFGGTALLDYFNAASL